MSDDGLSNDEITNLLFKNYMNFTSSLPDKFFYDESILSNNNNIFSSGILTDVPTVNPSFIVVDNDVSLNNYLSYSAIPDISINDTWFNEKKDMGGSFGVDSTSDENRTILRLENIKLDYLENKSSSFICKDLNGKNILQNLIPANYATSGYSMSIKYKNDSDVLMPMNWLASKSDLQTSTYINESVSFGGALFDAKNGVITFYDVDGDADAVFSDVSSNFYLTATKYIGLSNINTLRSLNITNDLSVTNDLTYNGTLFKGEQDIISLIDSSLSIIETAITNITGGSDAIDLATIESKLQDITHDNDSTTIIDGDVSINNNLIIGGGVSINDTLVVGGTTNFIGDANFGTNSSDVSLVLYGDLKIKAGGNLIIEDSSFSITEIHTDVKITDILDISNDGTGPALIVRQYDTSAQDIARFMDGDIEVFTIGNDGYTEITGDVSLGSNLFVSGDTTFNSIIDISGILTTSNDFVFKKGSIEKMIIDSSGIKFMNNTAVDISSTSALGLPVGTSVERPADEKTGHIRYNTTNGQFEGYGQGVWQGLGGVIDIDLDTKITTDDSNKLLFDTSGSTQMTIDSNGDVSMANSLNVDGALTIGSSARNIEDIISVDEYFVVTVSDKTNSHPYDNSGSDSAYFLNGIESPPLNFIVGKTYRFDQSDGDNGSHPLRFYTSADNTSDEYNTDISINGIQGQEGSYTQITITSETPDILYYQCSAHPYMGYLAKNNINIVDLSINTLETVTTDISYSTSDLTTIFENNIRIKNNIIIDGFANIATNLTVGGNVDISNTIYVDISEQRIGIKNSVPEYELDVSGDIHCTGTLFADSDLKVKKNLVPLDKSLDKLSNLNGYYYHKVGEEEYSLKHIGVIAQEVEAEYPELVSQNTHIKSVNYDGINAILIECVKELRKENLAIKSEMEELKNRFEKLEMNYN